MRFLLVSFILLVFAFSTSYGQDTITVKDKIFRLSEISGQYFISANYSETENINKMELKRGYFTIKTNINKVLSARYTQDITLDQEGSDAGNVEIRMKYLYLKAKVSFLKKFQDGHFIMGLSPRPWIDFEQKVNRYRVQSKMFIENVKIMSSADFGIMYEGLIGGKVDEEYQKNVNGSYPGKYGSFGIGVYNGGGYHATEENNNKTVEGRLSLRPFPGFMPGFQASYAFAFGKANLPANSSDFKMHLIYLSSESKFHTLAAQYYYGVGDTEGKYVNSRLVSQINEGYSIFGEIKLPKSNFSIVGRYDFFNSELSPNLQQKNIFGGIAYHFQKNKLMLNYEHEDVAGSIDHIYEIALEIKF